VITEKPRVVCIAPHRPYGEDKGRVAIVERSRGSHPTPLRLPADKASGGESNLLLETPKLSQDIVGRVIDTHSQRPAIFEQRAAILGIYKRRIRGRARSGLQERALGEIGLLDYDDIAPGNRPSFRIVLMIRESDAHLAERFRLRERLHMLADFVVPKMATKPEAPVVGMQNQVFPRVSERQIGVMLHPHPYD
jgi:hypothetical protein